MYCDEGVDKNRSAFNKFTETTNNKKIIDNKMYSDEGMLKKQFAFNKFTETTDNKKELIGAKMYSDEGVDKKGGLRSTSSLIRPGTWRNPPKRIL